MLTIFAASILAVGLGAASWSLMEYLLHRFSFHGASPRGNGAKEHRRHHAQVDYFASSWQKALAALPATAVILSLAVLAAGTFLGVLFTAGLLGMYVFYEFLHRRAHTHPPRGRYGRWLRRNHFAHHFLDPRRAQGVTTPFWDLVFGTRLAGGRVRVPRRLAMPWLVDADGELRRDFADDYELVGSRRSDALTRLADSEAAMANRSPDPGTGTTNDERSRSTA